MLSSLCLKSLAPLGQPCPNRQQRHGKGCRWISTVLLTAILPQLPGATIEKAEQQEKDGAGDEILECRLIKPESEVARNK